MTLKMDAIPIDFYPHKGKFKTIKQLQNRSFRYPPLSVAKYSFVQPSELWQRGMNEIAKT